MKTLLALTLTVCAVSSAATYTAGVAAVDVTPDFPVRLSGYGSRTEETREIQTRLFVKALALKTDQGQPAVLITADNCALILEFGDAVCARITEKSGVPRERIAINFSHTHSAPMLTGAIPNIFSKPIPPEHQAHIDQYTKLMGDAMVKAALDALQAMQPAKLYFGIGDAAFGTNRRTAGGPTDHDLPVLCVKSPDGAVRAIVAGYACHCTTVSANYINGDWSGYAQEAMQAAYPGAMGLVTIGCGADQNPMPRGTVEQAQKYGQAIADGVTKVLETGLREIDAPLDCALKRVPLAFDTIPTRAEWEERAKEESPKGYHARVQLAKLDRGETLATEIPYTVQTWAFGDQLAMIHLAGEVVVDYSTRFKIEYDRNRLWVCGYSNDVPCYIPSARILAEGGYEGADAMVYYDRPSRFAADVEDRIAATVHELVPAAYKGDFSKTNGFPPLRPYDALHEFVVPDGYEVQLVACEPQVVSPVAVDFAPDGAIFVAEMYDYNIAPDKNDPPLGRIRRLVDTNGDGFYDQAGVYLDNVPYPTGVTVWRNGILVCAAPDILFAEDTDNDGVADTRKVLFTGFAPGNYQARVNSLSWGLDNWMYGGGGLRGGLITRGDGTPGLIALGARDFRFKPDTLAFETATGSSQYGRARDDWDNWFGCDSSELLKYHALPEDLLKKAAGVVPPDTVLTLVGPPYDVYPVSTYVERLNDPDDLNRITSACGLAIYRDNLLGPAFTGNAFNCEPVHNLVTRLVVEPKGASFTARRAQGEERSEFLASKDHWFRPSQVRSAPDGSLWVVDMYRYVIEHEKWITPDRRELLDMFAGKDMGRIYRVKPKDAKLRPVQDLTKLSTSDLVDALNTPNGTVRDLVHQLLLWRNDPAAVEPLKALVNTVSATPQSRVQALAALDGLHGLDEAVLQAAIVADIGKPAASFNLAQETWRLRRHGVRLAASFLPASASLQDTFLKYGSGDALVDQAAAIALVDWKDERAAKWLGTKLREWSVSRLFVNGDGPDREEYEMASDPYVVTALLIASTGRAEQVTQEFTASPIGEAELVLKGLSRLAVLEKSSVALQRLFERAVLDGSPHAVDVLEAAKTMGLTLGDLAHGEALAEFERQLARANVVIRSAEADSAARLDAINLVCRAGTIDDNTLLAFSKTLSPDSPKDIQMAAIKGLASRDDAAVADFLLRVLPDLGPEAHNAALDALIRRDAWCKLLLDHLEVHPEAIQLLSAERKQFLTSHPGAGIRPRALAILGETAPTQRAAVLEKYHDATTLAGEAARGVTAFQERCAQCHQLGKDGHPVGPDLSALTDKSPAALLKAILDPNETVLEQYQSFTVETKDLRTLNGILAEDAANSIQLKMAEGLEETLLRSDIETLTNTAKSLMPEGLEENLSPQQVADVIAYIQSNTPAPKKFKGNAPALVTRAGDGSYALTAENGAIYGGPDFEYRPRFGAIGGWSTPGDHADWDLDIAAAGDFDVMMTWTAPFTSEGVPWTITCGAASLDGTLSSTGGYEDFILKNVGTLHLEPGRQTLNLHANAPAKFGLMELRAITLRPTVK